MGQDILKTLFTIRLWILSFRNWKSIRFKIMNLNKKKKIINGFKIVRKNKCCLIFIKYSLGDFFNLFFDYNQSLAEKEVEQSF